MHVRVPTDILRTPVGATLKRVARHGIEGASVRDRPGRIHAIDTSFVEPRAVACHDVTVHRRLWIPTCRRVVTHSCWQKPCVRNDGTEGRSRGETALHCVFRLFLSTLCGIPNGDEWIRLVLGRGTRKQRTEIVALRRGIVITQPLSGNGIQTQHVAIRVARGPTHPTPRWTCPRTV